MSYEQLAKGLRERDDDDLLKTTEYEQPLIRKNLPIFIRLMMTLSIFARIIFVAEFVGSLVIITLYTDGPKGYSEEEREQYQCKDCILYNILVVIFSSLFILPDILILSNAVGAYIRNHYGASVESSDRRNFNALRRFEEESPSTSAMCFGCGCCRCLGTVYQIDVQKNTITSDDSACSRCGNYSFLSIFPFPCTISCVRRNGYDGAVIISFMIYLVWLAITSVFFVLSVLCYTGEKYCIPVSSSLSSPSASDLLLP